MDFGLFSWDYRDDIKPCIVSAAYFRRGQVDGCRKIISQCWVVDYSPVDIGMVRVGSANARWQPRRAGVAHLYPPGTVYWEDGTGAPPSHMASYVTFTDGQAADFGRFVENKYQFARFLDPQGIIPACIAEMTQPAKLFGQQGFWLAQSALLKLIHTIHQSVHIECETYKIAPTEGKKRADLTQKVLKYIQGHYTEKITLADIARHLHMSPSSLSHRFKIEAGQSPMSYLADFRIRIAKAILLQGDTLSEVADKCGFYDAYHLSKTFKKITGTSPRDFLRMR